MAFGIPLLADGECLERQLAGFEGILPGAGEITVVEGSLGRSQVALRFRHLARGRLLGLRLPGRRERLARVAHLLHRRTGASAQHRRNENRGEA